MFIIILYYTPRRVINTTLNNFRNLNPSSLNGTVSHPDIHILPGYLRIRHSIANPAYSRYDQALHLAV
ncbi:MAG: hypothetical protein LBH70_10460 [Spirochaetaceae bacterium]|nr:hypothetical protein [Spirochaetaceae bacterium]